MWPATSTNGTTGDFCGRSTPGLHLMVLRRVKQQLWYLLMTARVVLILECLFSNRCSCKTFQPIIFLNAPRPLHPNPEFMTRPWSRLIKVWAWTASQHYDPWYVWERIILSFVLWILVCTEHEVSPQQTLRWDKDQNHLNRWIIVCYLGNSLGTYQK